MDNLGPIFSTVADQMSQQDNEQTTAQDIALDKIAEEIKKAKEFINYKALKGRDVINRYLIDKYHWLPKEVSALTYEELIPLLTEYHND